MITYRVGRDKLLKILLLYPPLKILIGWLFFHPPYLSVGLKTLQHQLTHKPVLKLQNMIYCKIQTGLFADMIDEL